MIKIVTIKNIVDSPMASFEVDGIEVLSNKTDIMGSSPDPNEMNLVPMVRISIFLTIKDYIDKLVINSIKISDKDIPFTYTGKNNIFIQLHDNELCDDILIDYVTKQDARENKLNELGVWI